MTSLLDRQPAAVARHGFPLPNAGFLERTAPDTATTDYQPAIGPLGPDLSHPVPPISVRSPLA